MTCSDANNRVTKFDASNGGLRLKSLNIGWKISAK